MSKKPSPIRQITCEVCGRQCQTEHKNRDICSRCHHKEPSVLCISCGNRKHLVSKDTGLCPRCANIAALPKGECARCSQFGIIFNQQDWLCKVCTKNARRRIRNKNKHTKVACSVCGKMCVPRLITRAICRSCSIEERQGRGICAGCGKHKVIYSTGKRLCKRCNVVQQSADHLGWS